ncbi:MAG: hypothetical protein WC750_01685 [Patescibacteria group bacterium]|jgi:hypothetical protein
MDHREGPPYNNELDAELIRLCFQGGKLDVDAIRNYLFRVDAARIVGIDELKSHPHYEEMLRERRPKEAEQFIQLSDPGAVAKYNELVDKFNADIERIKRENDLEAIKEFVREAIETAK